MTTANKDVSDVQSKLLNMLDSVRLNDADSTPVDDSDAPQVCENCGLEASWEGASWCPSCGFYPKLGRAIEIPTGNSTESENAEQDDLEDAPQEEEESHLGFWLVAGVCLLGMGAFIVFAVPYVLNGFGTQATAVSQEPDPVVGTATVDPQAADSSPPPEDVTADPQDADQQAGNQSAQSASDTPQAPTPKIELIVVGFTTNASGEMRSVLLAHQSGHGRLQFAAKLSLDGTDVEVRENLEHSLVEILTARPAVPCPYHARWVRPTIACGITYDDVKADGRLVNGQITGFRAVGSGS